jgi:hypothetical protein
VLQFTLEDFHCPSNNWKLANLTKGDIVKNGDLAACLVHVGESICLAIIEIISFECADLKRQLTSITIDEMEESDTGEKSKVTVLVQIVDLEQTNKSMRNWTHHCMCF